MMGDAARRGDILSDFSSAPKWRTAARVARLLQSKEYEITFETIKASN
jgi:hypothetical protein